MKKIRLLKPYSISAKGDILETAEGIADSLVERKFAEYVVDKQADVVPKIKRGRPRKIKNEL